MLTLQAQCWKSQQKNTAKETSKWVDPALGWQLAGDCKILDSRYVNEFPHFVQPHSISKRAAAWRWHMEGQVNYVAKYISDMKWLIRAWSLPGESLSFCKIATKPGANSARVNLSYFLSLEMYKKLKWLWGHNWGQPHDLLAYWTSQT